jgi:F-type H+-transporting ATPase subunit a
MEKLEHQLWIVQAANALFGSLVARMLTALGFHVKPGAEVIPNYIVMVYLVVIVLSVLAFFLRSRLSVENPGKLQIVFEDLVGALGGMLEDIVGPKGRGYLTLVGTIGFFILTANLMGLIPGLMAPTTSINVTLGCALTVWVFYHIQGVRAQGLLSYLKHFAAPPGAPLFIAPVMLPIEIISHFSRVLSLSLRLFGNSIVPFLVPLPMMFLGIITAVLQAFIFIMLTMIYLGGAVAAEHGTDQEHEHGTVRHAEGVAA